jgi:hypothetical protein
MHYAQINSKYVCGIDLHAREMYACVMNEKGEILIHRNMRTDFYHFKEKMKPFLQDLAVGAESTYMYYWLADACKEEGIPSSYQITTCSKVAKNNRYNICV